MLRCSTPPFDTRGTSLFHIGLNVARSFGHFEVFGAYLSYVGGTDTHAGHALTFGISLSF